MAGTYSFDVVSDFDRQELLNAVDQLRRETSQRYDLKDSNTLIDLNESDSKKGESKVKEMCEKLLANQIIEDFQIKKI